MYRTTFSRSLGFFLWLLFAFYLYVVHCLFILFFFGTDLCIVKPALVIVLVPQCLVFLFCCLPCFCSRVPLLVYLQHLLLPSCLLSSLRYINVVLFILILFILIVLLKMLVLDLGYLPMTNGIFNFFESKVFCYQNFRNIYIE